MFSFLQKSQINQVGNPNGEVISLVFPAMSDLPPSSQGYHTNNLYDGFPPLMSDTRSLIASWQPEAFVNNQLIQSSGIRSNWEYRRYLTQNAEQIMRDNFSSSANDIGYYANNEFTSGTGPYANQFSTYDKESDLKNMYQSREELQALRIAPVITQEELLRMTNRLGL